MNAHNTVEPYRFIVPPPSEMLELTTDILDEAQKNQMPLPEWQQLSAQMTLFNQQWAACFERFGDDRAGELSYRDLITELNQQLVPWLKYLTAGQGEKALHTVLSLLQTNIEPPAFNPQQLVKERKKIARRLIADFTPPVFERPIFIISAPRAGSTLLFENLARFPDVWTTGEESHELIEGIPELHPEAHNYTSNRLTSADATPSVIALLQDRFARQLQNSLQGDYLDLPMEKRPNVVRFLEKTPKNALRIPFLKACFPDALFVVLYRTPEETISSMLEGWRSSRFVAYQPLPGWSHRAWKFLLTPGWESLNHRPLVEIVAHQWRVTYETIFADLQNLPRSSWHFVDYSDLVQAPQKTLQKIANFVGLTWDEQAEKLFEQNLPLSSMTLSLPKKEKWLKNADELETVLPQLQTIIKQIEEVTQYSTSFIERNGDQK